MAVEKNQPERKKAGTSGRGGDTAGAVTRASRPKTNPASPARSLGAARFTVLRVACEESRSPDPAPLTFRSPDGEPARLLKRQALLALVEVARMARRPGDGGPLLVLPDSAGRMAGWLKKGVGGWRLVGVSGYTVVAVVQRLE